jgi:hypothetical protein
MAISSSRSLLCVLVCLTSASVERATAQLGTSQVKGVPRPEYPLRHYPSRLAQGMPMPSVAPLYLESDTYSSTLYVVNRFSIGIQTDVMVYDMTGALLATKHLYLQPTTQQAISIRKILSDGGFFSEAGSVEIVTPTSSAPVLGQLSITRTGMKKAYLDEEFVMPEKGASQTLRSVIDSPENSPIPLRDQRSKTA